MEIEFISAMSVEGEIFVELKECKNNRIHPVGGDKITDDGASI